MFFCAAVAGPFVLTACGAASGAADAAEAGISVEAQRLCGGTAVSAKAGAALEVITGAALFAASGEKATVQAAARELVRMGASTAIGNGDICRIHPPAGSSVEEVRVTWEMSADEPQGAGAPRFTPLPMGERAGAATDGAYVAFACTGGDLPGGSTRHLRVVVQKGGTPVVPDGDERGLREAYATVAHSFALALAEEIGCRDADLPAEPSLAPGR
ncbi:hypothetical protein [Streptomyces zhihengii]|uniref:hypothetical protein n=1 Tax=Streptomyces zhihengii TaxID=1818004 RepID=UPI00339EB156